MSRGRRATSGRVQGLRVVVLAAGKGTRMKSDLPKVLQPLNGWPLLRHVVETSRALKPIETVVVIGHGADAVRAAFADQPLTWALQAEQLGTGHAMQVGLAAMGEGEGEGEILVLYGDVPLLRAATLKRLVTTHRKKKAAVTVLTARLADPTGYGRVLREGGGVRIVEHKDA
ncbi:MAG: NTP transferase domain-containing protein, partial [Myxococcales bacterium]|nr:NTP transferase domain-containing protein [Myxococcales bacterium]